MIKRSVNIFYLFSNNLVITQLWVLGGYLGTWEETDNSQNMGASGVTSLLWECHTVVGSRQACQDPEICGHLTAGEQVGGKKRYLDCYK